MKTSAVNTSYEPHRLTKIKRILGSGSTYKIFIVEDNHISLMQLEKYLSNMSSCPNDKKPNLNIYSFETGEECISAMYLKPDIVILDFYLDEADPKAPNGLEVLKKIKAKNPSTKVVIISGQDSVMLTAELYNQGADDYISKEHYAFSRVERSVLNLIDKIEEERKSKNRRFLITGIMLMLLTIIIGVLI